MKHLPRYVRGIRRKIISQGLKLETVGQLLQQIYLNSVPLFRKASVYFILQFPTRFQSVTFPSFCDLLSFALKGVLVSIFPYFYQKWKQSLTRCPIMICKLLGIFTCANTGKQHLSFDITVYVLHLLKLKQKKHKRQNDIPRSSNSSVSTF